MNWFYLRFSAFSDSVFRLIKQPITSILHILGMGIAQSIPMGCYMLLDGADQFSRKLNNTSQLNVFITADSSDETIKIAEKQHLGVTFCMRFYICLNLRGRAREDDHAQSADCLGWLFGGAAMTRRRRLRY